MGNASALHEMMQLSAGNAAIFAKLASAAKRFRLASPVAPAWSSLYGVIEVDFEAIARQSMWEYFDFKAMRPLQGFWTEGTTLEQIAAYLQKTLTDLAAQGILPTPGSLSLIQAPNGQWVELQLDVANTDASQLKVARFHPAPRPGTVSLSLQELKAIAKAL